MEGRRLKVCWFAFHSSADASWASLTCFKNHMFRMAEVMLVLTHRASGRCISGYLCGQALGSLSQWEWLCSQGWTAFQISWRCPPTWRGCRIQLEVSKMTSLLYHVGGEDSLQGRQHMFKLKYHIISQTGKGNCEQQKEYVLSPFYDV